MENLTKRPEKCSPNHTKVSENTEPNFAIRRFAPGQAANKVSFSEVTVGKRAQGQRDTHTQSRDRPAPSGPNCINTQAK